MSELKIRVQTSLGDVDYFPITEKTCYVCGVSIIVNFPYFTEVVYPEFCLCDLAFNFVSVDSEVI